MAKGVAEAVVAGIVPESRADGLLLITAVWVDPKAQDPEAVFSNNAEAAQQALAAGSDREPKLESVLAARARPFNPFFRR